MVEIIIALVFLVMGFGMGLVASKPIFARRAKAGTWAYAQNGEDYLVVRCALPGQGTISASSISTVRHIEQAAETGREIMRDADES